MMNRSYFAKNKIRHLFFILPAFLFLFFFAACGFFGEVKRIGFTQTSDNMSPTIRANESFGCALNRFFDTDFKSDIKRGSVVVVAIQEAQIPQTGDIKPLPRRGPGDGKHVPPIAGHREFVYRIAGVGGDRVRIANGRVYVNDALFEQIPGNRDKSSIKDFAEVVVPPGEYFLLSDNLEDSFDSRFWKNMTLSEDKIICEVNYVIDGSGRSRNP
jgi:signal peptidase I